MQYLVEPFLYGFEYQNNSNEINLAVFLAYNQIKSFFILAVIRRSVQPVCGAHLRVIAPVGNTAPFKEMLQRWRAVGNTVSVLTGPRFEPQTYRSRDECVTAQPTLPRK